MKSVKLTSKNQAIIPFDKKYAQLLELTLGEWLSPEDEEAYRDL